MKKSFKYTKPELVDLRGATAAAAQCSYGQTASDGDCNDGSCVYQSLCNSGTAAHQCVTGTRACNPGGACMGCCQSGSSVMSGATCWCNGGNFATWSCSYGGNASEVCTSTGAANYGYC